MSAACRVLVVEDEFMVAMLVEDMLADLGHEVVGPAYRLEQGRILAENEAFDIAILDINLGGAQSFPIADTLLRRGIPFVFATGYGHIVVDAQYAGAPIIAKPFTLDQLSDAFARLKRGALPSSN